MRVERSQKPPEGWFVRSEMEPNGDVIFYAANQATVTNPRGWEEQMLLKDQVFTAEREALPAWLRWTRLLPRWDGLQAALERWEWLEAWQRRHFERRSRLAVERAQRRADKLNRQYAQSKSFLYRAEREPDKAATLP